MDGVIAGLEIVLAQGAKPGACRRPGRVRGHGKQPEGDLRRGVWDRYAEHERHLGRNCKRRGRGAMEPMVNSISDGIAAFWTHYVVEPDKLALETKRAKLEAARWPEFADIAPR